VSRSVREGTLTGEKTMRGDVMPQVRADAKILVLPATDLLQADDSALVSALGAGDPRAPRVVWQRFVGLVYLILRRALGQTRDVRDVDDLAHAVFTDLFRQVVTLREPSTLPTVVITITSLIAQRELRRRWFRRWLKLLPAHDAGQSRRGATPDPEARQALGRFYEILNKLPARDRTAFVLRSLVGLELGEVAAVLDLSLAATQRHLAHARARVVHHLEQDPAFVDYLSEIDKESA
jgi:RNA polymerase sigma-70 factor (ECF subfamily)